MESYGGKWYQLVKNILPQLIDLRIAGRIEEPIRHKAHTTGRYQNKALECPEERNQVICWITSFICGCKPRPLELYLIQGVLDSIRGGANLQIKKGGE